MHTNNLKNFKKLLQKKSGEKKIRCSRTLINDFIVYDSAAKVTILNNE